MKKTVSVCMTAVMALSLLAGGAVQAYALSAETAEPVFAVAEENCISGSWKRASDPTLTEKVRKVFDKAFEGLEGVSYTPVALLASRTTGFGTQYRILCKATVVVPGAQEEYVVVTLQHSWLSKAEILDIGDPLCLTNLDYEEGTVGAWQETEFPGGVQRDHRGLCGRGLCAGGSVEHPDRGRHELPHPVRSNHGLSGC